MSGAEEKPPMFETLKSVFGTSGVDTEAHARIARGALVVDVRTPEEYASGHFRAAKNIPVQSLASRASELPKNRPLVLYCRSGARSASAKRLLESLGFGDVYDAGGIHRLG
jgi:rhodanese-related sulfurtransferase